MRSVYTKALASTVAVLAFSFVVFLMLVRINSYTYFERGGPFGGLLGVQVAEAETAWQSGGVEGLSQKLDALAQLYPETHRYLVDRSGQDLLTGIDLSSYVRRATWMLERINLFDHVYVAKTSADGQYILLFTPADGNVKSAIDLFYVLVVVAIGLLWAAIAFHFISPLNRLTDAVQKFGAGDLRARVRLDRADELGDLASNFDRMADHIEELLIAERRLLQDISHELRSPLARLSFAVELVRTSRDQTNAFARVKKEIDRLDELIGTLLQVTSTQGHPGGVQTEPLLLSELIEEVTTDCQIEAGARGCQLITSFTAYPLIYGDDELLRRAFENVIRNAIRHAPAETLIDVSTTMRGNRAVVTVRDYGPGVPEGHLENIFKPFFRVDGSRDASTGGVGLGLSIVQRAIAIHGGNVCAENARPGLRVVIELTADSYDRALPSESLATSAAEHPRQ